MSQASDWRGFLAYRPIICKVFFVIKDGMDVSENYYHKREARFDKLLFLNSKSRCTE
jgi:hypothetical protein